MCILQTEIHLQITHSQFLATIRIICSGTFATHDNKLFMRDISKQETEIGANSQTLFPKIDRNTAIQITQTARSVIGFRKCHSLVVTQSAKFITDIRIGQQTYTQGYPAMNRELHCDIFHISVYIVLPGISVIEPRQLTGYTKIKEKCQGIHATV